MNDRRLRHHSTPCICGAFLDTKMKALYIFFIIQLAANLIFIKYAYDEIEKEPVMVYCADLSLALTDERGEE